MRAMVFGVAIAAMAAPESFAQEACPTPDQLTGPAVSFDALFAKRSDVVPQKGEFETTAQYEARRKAAQPLGLMLVEVEVNTDRFKYDADGQRFLINTIYLEPSDLPFTRDLREQEQRQMLEVYGSGYDYHSPVMLMAYDRVTSEENYQAQNAYGATFMVTDRKRTKAVVFDNPGRKGGKGIYDTFVAEKKRSDDVGTILSVPANIEVAPSLKGSLRAVAWLEPRPPFFDQRDEYSPATASLPIAETTDYRIVHADLKCFGIRDSEGNLLAHWKTR